jgi:mono/diheme cytochrome c family protein
MIALAIGVLLILCAGIAGAFTPAGDGTKWVAPASASGKKNPVAASDASIQAGKKIFGKECTSCHGKTGVGNGPKAADLEKPPGNLTTKEFQSQTDGAIFWKITKGKKPMPTFATAYTDEERWSVVNYLRTFGK